jgi:hypothetical protein
MPPCPVFGELINVMFVVRSSLMSDINVEYGEIYLLPASNGKHF